jgi:class 3 adenylate cyclase
MSIGVTSIGYRGKLLAAITALREGVAPPRDVTDREPTAKEDTSGPVSPNAERRQLTMMFSDLVGSTAVSGYRHRHIAAEIDSTAGRLS